MKEYSNKKYIYSVKHANELIEKGFTCIGTGYNAKSGRFYWVFDYYDVQPYYESRKE